MSGVGTAFDFAEVYKYIHELRGRRDTVEYWRLEKKYVDCSYVYDRYFYENEMCLPTIKPINYIEGLEMVEMYVVTKIS